MADFEIIEADFQQYYNLDVAQLGFQRYARLLLQLPPESRLVQKYSPFKDWNWDKEMQSQILHVLDILVVQYANAHRKKGAVALKVPSQVRPDYVKKAMKELKKVKRENNKEAQKELAEIFDKRNARVKKIEGGVNE